MTNRNRRLLLLLVGLLAGQVALADSFRVLPYLQNPAQDAITVRWLSDAGDPGVLTVETPDGPRVLRSAPRLAETLAYNPFKVEPQGPHPGLPWLHSIPFGKPDFSGQAGIAMRVIQPLLFRYGVDAVISGHDELLERSLAAGTETLADGSTRPHNIHFYDVGIGGGGLRGPSKGFDNPYRKFLAHEDWPEVWHGKQLVSGGKHYGHLEVNVALNSEGQWQAELTPVQVFPLLDGDGKVIGWDRCPAKDVVTLTAPSEKQP